LAGKEADWFEITPKLNNDEKVFSGKIALSTDEGWIVGLDVSVNHYAIQYHFEIDFESVQSVVLPQKYQISTTGKLMGFQGEYQYIAHVWNYQLGNIEPIVRPSEHQFREVYNIQERNFEVQQFKQVMGTLGSNLENTWSDANIGSGLKRYDKINLEVLPESQSQEWWDNLKKSYQTKTYLPSLSISAISKSTLPPQPDEYATYRQTNLKFGVGSVLFSRSYFWEIIREVFIHTKFTINLLF
jgi:hypothetical protein